MRLIQASPGACSDPGARASERGLGTSLGQPALGCASRLSCVGPILPRTCRKPRCTPALSHYGFLGASNSLAPSADQAQRNARPLRMEGISSDLSSLTAASLGGSHRSSTAGG